MRQASDWRKASSRSVVMSVEMPRGLNRSLKTNSELDREFEIRFISFNAPDHFSGISADS